MGYDPQFGATPAIGSGAVSATADNTWTAPTHAVTIVATSTNGALVNEIVAQGIGITLAGIVNLFLYDGSTYHLYNQFKFAGISGSTTVLAERFTLTDQALNLPSTWSLVATSMVASQLVVVTAFGETF